MGDFISKAMCKMSSKLQHVLALTQTWTKLILQTDWKKTRNHLCRCI